MGEDNVAVEVDGQMVAVEQSHSSKIELENGDAAATETTTEKKCCNAARFDGNQEAQGYALLTIARGGIIMSNIFLSTALIRLASESAGCVYHDDDDTVDNPECNEKVYGFRPSSLIAMIAVVSGILSAFFLPIIGAVVDYTSHRKLVGIVSAVFITAVQGLQIWLNTDTWFAMSIMQAINGFMYMVQVLAIYAYLPDIGRHVGATKMMSFSGNFTMSQFASQLTYLVINLGLQLGLKLDEVLAAQVSQAVCIPWLLLTFVPAWRKMPPIPALHTRPEGKSFAAIGFSQNWKTMVGVNKYYGSGLRWFFLGLVFSEAGANAFTSVSVTFMVEVLDMSGTQVGIVFLCTLFGTLPGSLLGVFISKKTNPIISWKINLVVFTVVTVAGALVLTGPARQNICYIFGGLWGMLLGWFYPLGNVIFAMCMPKGQEAEFSGFYNYCRVILTWLPPLIFTTMNEAGIEMKWGLMSLVIFLLLGLVFLQLMAPWEDVLEDAKVNKMIARTTVVKPAPSPDENNQT